MSEPVRPSEHPDERSLNESVIASRVAQPTTCVPPRPRSRAFAVREGVLECPARLRCITAARSTGVASPGASRVRRRAGRVALGGISASARVAADDRARLVARSRRPGPRARHQRFRVLSFDYLGASADSTGPRDGRRPSRAYRAYDQAETAASRLLDHSASSRLRAIAGASYGGMVALAFGERYPERVARLVVISAADRAHPMATAWRIVQRRIVRSRSRTATRRKACELARALAMATYRSPEEFAARFAGAPRAIDGALRCSRSRNICSRAAREYASAYRPEAFRLSVRVHRPASRRCRRASSCRSTLVAVREDQLVPLADMRALVARLPGAAACTRSRPCTVTMPS